MLVWPFPLLGGGWPLFLVVLVGPSGWGRPFGLGLALPSSGLGLALPSLGKRLALFGVGVGRSVGPLGCGWPFLLGVGLALRVGVGPKGKERAKRTQEQTEGEAKQDPKGRLIIIFTKIFKNMPFTLGR